MGFFYFQKFTLETIGEVGFGEMIGCMELKIDEIEKSPFLRDFDVAQRLSDRRNFIPIWKLERWLDVGSERELRQCVERLREFAGNICHRRQQQLLAAGGGGGGEMSSKCTSDGADFLS